MESSKVSLRLVQIAFRHGDKGSEIENLKDAEESPLLETGKLRLRALGKFIKERYNGFLTDNINEQSARSSRVSRCMDSMVEVLKAIYKDYNELEDKEVRESILSKPILSDMMLFPVAYCPEADEELRVATKSLKPYLLKQADVFGLLQKNHGVNDLNEFGFFRSKIEASGSKMPNGITVELANKVHEISNKILAAVCSRQKLKLLRGSEFFKTIVQNMSDCIEKKSDNKLHLFCTHEHLIALFETILDAFNGFPSFGQSLIFELHEIDSEYFVVAYRLKVKDDQHTANLVQIYPKETGKYQSFNCFIQDMKDYLEFTLPEVDITDEKLVVQKFSLFA